MVREAALKASKDDVAHLRQTLERQRHSLGNAAPFINEDMRFHAQIAAIRGYPIFEAVSEAMLSWLKEYHTELLIWSGKVKFTCCPNMRRSSIREKLDILTEQRRQ